MRLSSLESDILTEVLPEALFLEDFQGNILDANNEACKMLGYEKEELLELAVEDLVPEEAPAFLPDRVDEATRSGEPLETVNLDKNGIEIPVELRGKIVEIDEEDLILVSIRDISKRKEKEQALKKQEKKYRAIFESANDAMLIMNENRFVDCNKKTLEIFECERDDIIGKPPWKFSPAKQPDGKESRKQAEKNIRKAINGEPQFFEWIHKRKDGSSFPAEVSCKLHFSSTHFLRKIIAKNTHPANDFQSLLDFLLCSSPALTFS